VASGRDTGGAILGGLQGPERQCLVNRLAGGGDRDGRCRQSGCHGRRRPGVHRRAANDYLGRPIPASDEIGAMIVGVESAETGLGATLGPGSRSTIDR
jgi:hypothetical protein